MNTLKGVKRDAKMRVGVLHRREGLPDPNRNAGFSAGLSLEAIFKAFIFFLFSPGKFPEPPEKTVAEPLNNQNPALVVSDDSGRDMVVGHGRTFCSQRQVLLHPPPVGPTMGVCRTNQTLGISCPANRRPQIHERLVEPACAFGRNKLFGQCPHALCGPALVHGLVNGKKPDDHPSYIGIHGRHRHPERHAQDRACRVSSNPRKTHELVPPMGNLASKLFHNPAGCRMEMSRTAVISHILPRLQHVVLGGGRQGLNRRKPGQKTVVVRNNRLHLRLLKHNLRNPYVVGIRAVSPRQVALMRLIPCQYLFGHRVHTLCRHNRVASLRIDSGFRQGLSKALSIISEKPCGQWHSNCCNQLVARLYI